MHALLSIRTVANLVVALVFTGLTASAQAADRAGQLLLVYWSSADCRWCAYWESSRSGMEQELRDSEEFKHITYRVVKNRRLVDPYMREDFPPDITWIYERMQRGEEKRPGRPGWVLYQGRKRLAAFYGTTRWDLEHFPEIRRLVQMHSGV
jgi:hypothetical protein